MLVSASLSATLPARIRAYRQSRDLSLRALSRLTGMSFSCLASKERGEYPYNIRDLERLAPALQLTLGELMTTSHPALVCACGAVVVSCATPACTRHQGPPRQIDACGVCTMTGAQPVDEEEAPCITSPITS